MKNLFAIVSYLKFSILETENQCSDFPAIVWKIENISRLRKDFSNLIAPFERTHNFASVSDFPDYFESFFILGQEHCKSAHVFFSPHGTSPRVLEILPCPKNTRNCLFVLENTKFELYLKSQCSPKFRFGVFRDTESITFCQQFLSSFARLNTICGTGTKLV